MYTSAHNRWARRQGSGQYRMCIADSRLVEVPMMVLVPPSSAANDSGMSSCFSSTCGWKTGGGSEQDRRKGVQREGCT